MFATRGSQLPVLQEVEGFPYLQSSCPHTRHGQSVSVTKKKFVAVTPYGAGSTGVSAVVGDRFLLTSKPRMGILRVSLLALGMRVQAGIAGNDNPFGLLVGRLQPVHWSWVWFLVWEEFLW